MTPWSSSVKVVPNKDGETVSLDITTYVPKDQFGSAEPPAKLEIFGDSSFTNIGGNKPDALRSDGGILPNNSIKYTAQVYGIDKTDPGLASLVNYAFALNGKKITERFDLKSPWTYGETIGSKLFSIDNLPASGNDPLSRCIKLIGGDPNPGIAGKITDISNNIKTGICSIITWVGNALGNLISRLGEKIIDFIEATPNYFNKIMSGWTKDVWGAIRNLVDIVAIIALIIIGFANILHINLNTYAVKRTLPMLIAGLVFANLSFYLTQVLITAGSALTGSLTDAAKEGMRGLSVSLAKLAPLALLAFVNPGVGCIVAVAVLIGVIALAILGFLALAQPVILSVLVIVAPLAFIAMALPMTKTYFDKWLALFFNWILMIPASLLIFALIGLVDKAGVSQTAVGTFTDALQENDADSANLLTALVSFGVRIILVIIAVRIPFKMGGDIAAAWGKAGKWAASLPAAGARSVAAGYKPKYEGGKWGSAVNKAKGLAMHGLPFVDPKLFVKGMKAPYERAEMKAYGKAETLSWGYGRLIGPEGVMMAEAESKRNEHREENTDPQVLGEVTRKILTDNKLASVDSDGKLTITNDILEKLYELAKIKKVKLWDAPFGRIEQLRGKKPSEFADLWAALTVLRQNAQAQRSPKAIGSREELRSLSLYEILGSKRPLGDSEGAFLNQGACAEPLGDGYEGAEGITLDEAIDGEVGGRGRVDELRVENMLVQNAEVSELGQLTTAADKVDTSRGELAKALKGANIGIDDAKLNDLVGAIQTYSEANTMQTRGLWWQSKLATPVLNRLSATLRKLGFTNEDEVQALEGLGSQTGSLSADDVLRLASVDPTQVSAEQKQPIEMALNRHQRAGQISDLTYEYHAVNNLEHQTGIEFPKMVSEVAEIGRVVKQPEDLNKMTGLINEGIRRIDSPEATSIQGISKIRQETLARALPQRLSVGQATDAFALKDQVKKELVSANAALRLASSNPSILEVAQRPGTNLAQIESAIKTNIGRSYAQQRQARVAANQTAMAAEKTLAQQAGPAGGTPPPAPPQ